MSRDKDKKKKIEDHFKTDPKKVEATERRINKLLKEEPESDERLRKLIEDE